jgi:hypothetical protein
VTFDPLRPTQPEPFSPASPESSAFPTETVAVPTPVPPTGPMSATNPVSPIGPVASPPPVGPVPTAPVVTTSRRSSGRWLNALLIFAAAVAIGGVAFAAGRTTASASTTGAGTGRNFGAGAGGFPNASGRPGFVNGGPNGQGFGRFGGLTLDGTVQSIDGNTLTLKTANGDTIEVTLGSDTTYATQTPATASDVTTGSKVQVRLDPTGINRQGQGGSTTAPLGTAGSVTVVP